MPVDRIQFGVKHLFAATILVASVIFVFSSLDEVYQIGGAVDQVRVGAGFVSVLFCSGLVMLFSKRARYPVIVVILLISSAISLRVSREMRELVSLRSEVARIVQYADNYFAENAKYPEDLNTFQWMRPDFRDDVEYKLDGYGYVIWFNLTGDRSYGHYYFPDSGYWFEDD